eukprot:Plantae.Rhodophyta-Hildenbrandia_rubra.ctg16273.p2 GENE.Plantae.Rhodophyta-Hildenbrandia_rubra.ctg16273~~Plantae.Rhodophyta-Hildenbrandia_rubra.ctg16273.p2  ORF type:complete len:441 (-),score=93.45 Plantae.Rhodophyta-Hildenbrandia_rubra.ctg16273:1980-3302(-)
MSRVGPYIVTDTLGQGTFGKVKLAIHQDTHIEYAIKILDKSDIKENELTVNVRREIAIMKALNHKNIVNLREVLSSKSKLYIVMDLVRGGELFDMIESKGELDERLARKYFQQLVDGIDYCHRRGVCHRDLKPENLLVDEKGTLKITDFGVSSMKGGTSGGSDLLYTACGTPYYCAPEIINGAEEGYSGAKIDAWSCGIILYLLLTGSLPFQNEDMTQLYEQINRCKVDYPSWMPADARDLIANLLTKAPERRYSLEDVKRHPWFLVDYVAAEPSDSSTAKSKSTSGRSNSNRSKKGGRSSGTNGRRSRDQVNGSSNRRSKEQINGNGSALGPRGNSSGRNGHYALPPPPEEKPPVIVNRVEKYGESPLKDLVKDIMPRKSEVKINKVVDKLEALEIDCADDMQFLAQTMKNPKALTEWLEEKSQLPALTCMKISGFFFE